MYRDECGSRTVGLIFGGTSVEHSVSILSAATVYRALVKSRHSVIPIYVSKGGTWQIGDVGALLACGSIQDAELFPQGESLGIRPSRGSFAIEWAGGSNVINVLFPTIHGRNGEDGGLQGLCDVFAIPCVGSGILGSAVCMDKDITKRLLMQAGIEVPRFVVVRRGDQEYPDFSEIQAELGSSVFVKPCNMGSSIGISKAASRSDFLAACELALQFDDKCIVEEAVQGREIEIGILEGESLNASPVGEIVVESDYYSFDKKYTVNGGAEIVIPAVLDTEISQRARRLALATFRILECHGMARVDMFLKPDGQLLINEVNTIPGFTQTSMFPLLWEVEGMDVGVLVERLVAFAVAATVRRSELRILPN